MIIRKAQVDAFLNNARAAFEQEMVDHLFQFSPKHSQIIKESGVREVIQLGMQHAAAFGFTNRGPVRLFIELMFMFGSEFATDPQHPWAAPSLVETMPGDQMYRADLLYSAAQQYLEEVSGPQNQFAIAALQRTRVEINNNTVGRLLDLAPEQYESAILSMLGSIYPEKADYLTDEGLRTVVHVGTQLAAEHQLQQPRSTALLVFLVFSLGHGAMNDPLYPWVRNTLAAPRVANPEARAAHLESKAILYLDNVLAYVREM